MCRSKQTAENTEVVPLVDEESQHKDSEDDVLLQDSSQEEVLPPWSWSKLSFLILIFIVGILFGTGVSKKEVSVPIHDIASDGITDEVSNNSALAPTSKNPSLPPLESSKSPQSIALEAPKTSSPASTFVQAKTPTKTAPHKTIVSQTEKPTQSNLKGSVAKINEVNKSESNNIEINNNDLSNQEKHDDQTQDNISVVQIQQLKFTYDDIDWDDCIFKSPRCNNFSKYPPIIVEEYKLMFFVVPKNGSSEWLKLFRRMMGYDDWKTLPPHDFRHNGLRRLDQYNKERQFEMMTSPEWTRGMFVRNPLERVLSAYLNKGLSHERYLKKFCCDIRPRRTNKVRKAERNKLQRTHKSCLPLAPYEQLPTQETFPFEMFVDEFMCQCDDIHWRPQSARIRHDNWKFLNFFGSFDNLYEDAKTLLQKVGAYHEFAESGWGDFGDLGLFERERSVHEGPVTHSRDRIDEFYTPELKAKVLEYSKQDYINQWLNITRPEDFRDVINN